MTAIHKQIHIPQTVVTNWEWRKGENRPIDDSHSKTRETTREKLLNQSKVMNNTRKITQIHTAKNTIAALVQRKPKSKIPAASASEFAWKTISKTLSLYSSYYDRRYVKTNLGVFNRSLVVLGYEFGIISENLFCVVVMDNNERKLVEEPALRYNIAEMWKNMIDKYKAFMYRCKLEIPGKPRYVTLTNSTTTFKDIPFTSFIPVVDPYFRASRSVAHKFGVCYGSPLHSFRYDQDIMDSIEMNKLLGATWFTIYVYEAGDKAIKILKYYSQELKILNAVLNWGGNLPSPTFNKGQLVGLHDCIYRNMYRVQFLALCDLDELIMPLQGLNWHELFSEIDRPNLAHFVFAHLGFHNNQTHQTSESFHCFGKLNMTYKMPRFFAMYERSVSVLRIPKQAKSVAKPRFLITAHVHSQRKIMPGYTTCKVPQDVALMKHFRDRASIWDKDDNTTLDYSMDRFKPALMAAVEKHFCRKIA